jgi:hypothetical protein
MNLKGPFKFMGDFLQFSLILNLTVKVLRVPPTHNRRKCQISLKAIWLKKT